MRSTFIGLALFFFTLSAFVIYKAFHLSGNSTLVDQSLTTAPQVNTTPDSPVPAKNNEPDESADAIENLIAELELKNTPLPIPDVPANPVEEKSLITEQDKIVENPKQANPQSRPRTLTVFSGRTFRSGYDVVHEAASSKLKKLVDEISVFPNSPIIIEGHTDNIPTGRSNRSNLDLSERRAKAIADLLVNRGIPRERITVVGYGDTRPIDTNNTEEGRAKNRRVEVKLMLKEGEN